MHVVGHIIDGLEHGTALFVGWTASSALGTLRTLLGLIGVEHAGKYRCHDIRRGHAVDLQLAGVQLFPHVRQVFHDRVSSTKELRCMRYSRLASGGLPRPSITLTGMHSSET